MPFQAFNTISRSAFHNFHNVRHGTKRDEISLQPGTSRPAIALVSSSRALERSSGGIPGTPCQYKSFNSFPEIHDRNSTVRVPKY